MKKFITLAIFFLGCAGFGLSQQTTPPSATATPGSTQQTQINTQQATNTAIQQQRAAEQARLRREQQSFDNLRNLTNLAEYGANNTSRVMRMNISPLYRNPTKKELLRLKPDPVDLQKYSEFLKQKNTGIFVLVPDAGCSGHSNVLVVSPECLEHKFPGAGSSYSFRTENYRLPDLADITYGDGILSVPGVLIDQLFVDLGNQEIDKIHLNTPGVKYLSDFPPSKTTMEAFERAKALINGISHDNFAYGRGVFAKENGTSAVRLIAYRARHIKYVEGVTYDEFGFDKRRDMIVAFRIIRKDEDGTITVLWKELQNKKAPKIKIVSEEKDKSSGSK